VPLQSNFVYLTSGLIAVIRLFGPLQVRAAQSRLGPPPWRASGPAPTRRCGRRQHRSGHLRRHVKNTTPSTRTRYLRGFANGGPHLKPTVTSPSPWRFRWAAASRSPAQPREFPQGFSSVRASRAARGSLRRLRLAHAVRPRRVRGNAHPGGVRWVAHPAARRAGLLRGKLDSDSQRVPCTPRVAKKCCTRTRLQESYKAHAKQNVSTCIDFTSTTTGPLGVFP